MSYMKNNTIHKNKIIYKNSNKTYENIYKDYKSRGFFRRVTT